MNKERFYQIMSDVFQANITDQVVFTELPSFSSITIMELIAQLEQEGVTVELMDLLNADNAAALYACIKQ